jgi:TrmH family RNA methyltransferase
LSKNQIKLINSLKTKKNRFQHLLFVVEGIKTVHEFLNSNYQLSHLYTTSLEGYEFIKKKTLILPSEMMKISQLSTPTKVLALFEIPPKELIKTTGLMVALDCINDPGNLGTIVRLCDWFGVDQLSCSHNTVDCYNPKTVMASMGSLSRLSIVYTDLKKVIENTKLPVYSTTMQGDDIYKTSLPKEGIIIFGNEANGISKELLNLSTQRISIPQAKKEFPTESINVANAAAIILSEFKRNELS